jgi:hypothetical protein
MTTTKDSTAEALARVDVAAVEAADATRSKATQVKDAVGDAAERMPEVLEGARSGAERARVGVEETTTRLQTLPDETLRLLAAGSMGLAAGLFASGAPRLFTLAALAPALLVGGAMATRSK